MIVVRGAELAFQPLPGRRTADPLHGQPTEGVSVRVVLLERVARRNPHRHPHSPEVVYVAEGTGIAWQDGQTRPVGPGDLVYIPAGVPHATLPDPGGRMRLVCFFPHPDLPANTEELTGISLPR